MEHCIVWLRDLDTKKIEAEVFVDHRNMMLEENGKDKHKGERSKTSY